MSADAQAPVPTTSPDPPRPGPAVPAAIGCVLRLVRKLIDYGKEIAGSLQQRAGTPGFARFARPFGTADLAIILARITNGLRRAAELEARLCRRAARGQDLLAAPVRLPAPRGPRAARQVAAPDARPARRRAGHIENPRLARLPTEEEIAAAVRRRPVGAVIADICHDLGIVPGHLDRAFWDEIKRAITHFFRNLSIRWLLFGLGDRVGGAGAAWPGASARSPVPATGPP